MSVGNGSVRISRSDFFVGELGAFEVVVGEERWAALGTSNGS